MNEDYKLVLSVLQESPGVKFKAKYLSSILGLNTRYIGRIMREYKERGVVKSERISPKSNTHRWWIPKKENKP